MNLLHRLSTTATYCYDAQLIQQHQDILCVLFSPDLLDRNTSQDETVFQDVLVLLTFDVQKGQSENTLIYNCYGPPYDPARHAFIRYDSLQKRWVIAQQQGDWYIGMRTATEEAGRNLILSPLCLLDKEESDRGFHLLLDLEIIEGRYRFLSHKAVVSHLSAPVVSSRDIILHQPGWNTLEERDVVSRSENAGEDGEISRWQQWLEALRQKPASAKGQHLLDKILLPEHTFFDPGTTNASQSAELEVVNQREIAQAENALSLADQQTRLLVLCSPESWFVPNKHPRSPAEIERTGEQWRLWLTGWDRSVLTYKWTYSPDIGLPTDPNLPAHDHPIWPDVEVTAIPGPGTTNNQPTFVATMAMQGTGELLSHGVCLTHEGQVVQVCNAALGRTPSLCLCQQIVIGVDRLAGGWRLWNWLVLDEATLRVNLPLDATCQRAFVLSQPDTERFWLIEELATGVRVSQRDARTLDELAPAELIAETTLLAEEADRPLEPQRNVGLIPYQETLLLLLAGKQEELLLYQVQ
ncbi:MAG: hypothetical protein H0W02_15870 [Ktedonobacteraceae bacterium]|nr:hypothetical protein [Ktedonobacteraceae bacterium]